MSSAVRFGTTLGLIAVAAMVFATFASGVTSATTTYSVNLKEIGLPSGTSWSATFNGVTNTGTGTSQVFTGLSAGYYCWNYENPVPGTASTTRYVPYDYSGCFSVPNQLTVTDSYVPQVYVNFAVTPSGSGGVTPGSNWFNTGTPIAIEANEAYGYTFTKWTTSAATTLKLANTTIDSTELTINATGTVTAHFLATKTKVTFDEVGLPTGSSWSVVFGGVSFLGATAAISTGTHSPAGYSWSVGTVSAAHGIVYAPDPSSGYLTVPYQPTQEIVFVQEVTVTVAVSPASSGSTNPYPGTYEWANNSNIPITALNPSGYVFSSWSPSIAGSFGIGSKTTAGTNATLHGSGTLTAKFVTGTPCTTCALTFYEVGLPAGTGWGVNFASTNYATTGNSISLTGITAGASWTAFNPVNAGVYGEEYVPSTYSSSGYYSLGATTSQTIVYVEEDYLTVYSTPGGAGSTTIGSAWYLHGSTLPASAVNSEYDKFSSWTSSGHNLTLGSSTSSSTSVKIMGAATLVANFVSALSTIHFVEYGLPSGTTWGAEINGQWHFANTAWINISGVPDGGYSWAAGNDLSAGPGIEWTTSATSGGFTLPVQSHQAVVYLKAYQVTFTTAGTAGGTTNPSGSGWYTSGTIVPIWAQNGTSATFSSWGKTTTSGTITLSSTSLASTYATIKGTGTVTATFA